MGQLILIENKVKADKNTQAGPCYLKKGEKGYPKLTGQPSFISFYFTTPNYMFHTNIFNIFF